MFGLSAVMGLATAFNILIIFKKIEKKRHQDAFFDAGLLILLTVVFGGSLGGMMVATVASAIISFYFLFNEPNIFPKLPSKKPSEPQKSTKQAEDDLDSLFDLDSLLAQYNL